MSAYPLHEQTVELLVTLANDGVEAAGVLVVDRGYTNYETFMLMVGVGMAATRSVERGDWIMEATAPDGTPLDPDDGMDRGATLCGRFMVCLMNDDISTAADLWIASTSWPPEDRARALVLILRVLREQLLDEIRANAP